VARRRPDSGPKLDSADFEALSSTEVATPNKVIQKKITDADSDSYLRNPKLKKTRKLYCEADMTGHEATHFFTPQGGGEVSLCKTHLDTAVTHAIINNKTIKQRPITVNDVEPHALKRRLEMHAQRSVIEDAFRASGLTGADALHGREKEELGGGRRRHRDPNIPVTPGKELAKAARAKPHPAEEVLAAVEENGGHNVLRDLNILNAKKNKIEQPQMYDGAGNRIYELDRTGKTKPISAASDQTFEEIRAEGKARRSEAARNAKNTGRFVKGSNVNPGRGKVPVLPGTGPKESNDTTLGKAFEIKADLEDKRQLSGISSATEAERLRHIERLKTDPAYRKAEEAKARKNAQNKSAPPFTT
jgi:hypothetical protein